MKKRYVINASVYGVGHKCIGTGRNNYTKSHPIQAYFARKAEQPARIYLHAEIAALLKAGDRKVIAIFVSRYDQDGNMCDAEPCKVCKEAIKAYGVQKVSYTTPNGWKQWENEDAKNTHKPLRKQRLNLDLL